MHENNMFSMTFYSKPQPKHTSQQLAVRQMRLSAVAAVWAFRLQLLSLWEHLKLAGLSVCRAPIPSADPFHHSTHQNSAA